VLSVAHAAKASVIPTVRAYRMNTIPVLEGEHIRFQFLGATGLALTTEQRRALGAKVSRIVTQPPGKRVGFERLDLLARRQSAAHSQVTRKP
jgi:hypothetical protein